MCVRVYLSIYLCLRDAGLLPLRWRWDRLLLARVWLCPTMEEEAPAALGGRRVGLYMIL